MDGDRETTLVHNLRKVCGCWLPKSTTRYSLRTTWYLATARFPGTFVHVSDYYSKQHCCSSSTPKQDVESLADCLASSCRTTIAASTTRGKQRQKEQTQERPYQARARQHIYECHRCVPKHKLGYVNCNVPISVDSEPSQAAKARAPLSGKMISNAYCIRRRTLTIKTRTC